MAKDLTNSQIDRQNVLNNELALTEIEKKSKVVGIIFENKVWFTKAMVSDFFEVDIRTIERYTSEFSDELQSNGYEILKGKRLKRFLEAFSAQDVPDINVGNISSKIPQLSIFDFRSFLNLSMLLSESEKAKILRQMILDIIIDLINQKTGVGTKYINQRDRDFISASLAEENYRRKFTDALKNYVCENKRKYAKFTDMIYVSIFKENASAYKKILDLKAKDKVRDTFYSEVLDIISSYECGLAASLEEKSKKLNRVLTITEAENLFEKFEKQALWIPFIHRGRTKMSSRDLALRDAFHFQLSEYIKPLEKEEYEKFLGATGDELDRLMEENKDVLKRLKDSE